MQKFDSIAKNPTPFMSKDDLWVKYLDSLFTFSPTRKEFEDANAFVSKLSKLKTTTSNETVKKLVSRLLKQWTPKKSSDQKHPKQSEQRPKMKKTLPFDKAYEKQRPILMECTTTSRPSKVDPAVFYFIFCWFWSFYVECLV
eukprot:m.30400 g.30400  ORF g.30400 m.30400 type:complete len:142 (+) comp8200_c0_seq2:201-626(+)